RSRQAARAHDSFGPLGPFRAVDGSGARPDLCLAVRCREWKAFSERSALGRATAWRWTAPFRVSSERPLAVFAAGGSLDAGALRLQCGERTFDCQANAFHSAQRIRWNKFHF